MVGVCDAVSMVTELASKETFRGAAVNTERLRRLKTLCAWLDAQYPDLLSVDAEVSERTGEIRIEIVCPFCSAYDPESVFPRSADFASSVRVWSSRDDVRDVVKLLLAAPGIWEIGP